MGEAIYVGRHGGPEVLELRAHEPGEPGPGRARVRVEAAGVNFIDTYQRSGAYPRPLPFAAGLEGAGVVERVGEGVAELSPGDRVAWAQVPGSYATVLVAPVGALVRIPDPVPTEIAAAAMLQGMTAHYLVHGVRNPQPGDVALVHAAAGGTGQLLVQMLVVAGARVIATCSTEDKARLAREAGADEVIRYTEVDFAAEARRLTSGRGVDVVYDSVGQSTFDGSLRALRPRGLCVLFGQASGAVPPFDPQRLSQGGSLFLTRPTLAHYTATRQELELRAHAVLDAVSRGALRVRIDRSFPLAQAAEAHRLLESRGSAGKVLLLPS
ncbi:MAG: quinone oxidoreductase family protein [Polyangiales bacterium]